jgi:hypothetical protein
MGEREKYLFLDFDGVLNTMEYQTALQWKGERGYDDYGTLFDPYVVKCLEHIINKTAAKVVISSSWRLDGIDRMRELWKARLLPGEVYGVTPVLDELFFKSLDGGHDTFSVIPYGTRGLEIGEWLRIHPAKDGLQYNYAILDDGDDFLLTQSEHVVITEPETGITEEIAEKVIEILI